jgi:hypothetical protein
MSLEIHATLTGTLGEHAPSYATIKNWEAQFKRGDFSTFFFLSFFLLVGLRTYQHPGIEIQDNTSIKWASSTTIVSIISVCMIACDISSNSPNHITGSP